MFSPRSLGRLSRQTRTFQTNLNWSIRTPTAQFIGTVESVKAVADVFSPVSGEIVEANQNLPDKPELVNQNPYGDGWVAVIKPSNLEIEIKNLLDAKGYCEFLKSIIEKK